MHNPRSLLWYIFLRFLPDGMVGIYDGETGELLEAVDDDDAARSLADTNGWLVDERRSWAAA